MNPTVSARSDFDGPLIAAILVLVSFGVVLVYSASAVYADRTFGDATYFLHRHLAVLAVGLVAFIAVQRLPPDVLARRAGWLMVAAIVLCALVLIPGVGRLAGGARRWLAIPGFGFQPSELAKLAVVVVLASVLARRTKADPAERGSLLGPVLLAQVPVALILLEPDLGTALEIELIAAAMIFAAGLRVRTLIVLALAAMPLLYHLVVGTPFRLRRLLSYIDPWAYRSTIGYQVTEALISIGSGGIFGVGLGDSKHKLFFLPEAHTDFIFAILAEELGLIGAVVLMAAYAVLLWRGCRVAIAHSRPFEAYLALGITMLVAIPTVFNLCVATGVLPTKGLPLPLVSYGRSNLLMTFIALGILVRLSATAKVAGGNA